MACLSFITPVLFSQGVLEKLFYLLPAEYCMGWDLETRKSDIDLMKENYKNGDKFGSLIDEKNGYLCTYSSTQCAFEMCYWTYKETDGTEGYKIVGIKNGNCRGRVSFFKEKNGQLTLFTPDVMESFNALFFFKDGTKIEEIRDLADEYYMTLPQKGVNITILYGPAYRGENPDPELEKKNLLRGDKIDLIWKDGYFEMGKPYF